MTLTDAQRTTQKMLVLRALKLGDLLVAVPALKGLKRTFTHHRLVLAAPAWLSPIVDLIEDVDELLPTPGLHEPIRAKLGEYDIAVNLHGKGPESLERINALGARVRIAYRGPGHDSGPPWRTDMRERARWAALVSECGAVVNPDDVTIRVPSQRPPVAGAAVLHVGAAYPSRHWPAERFAVVARSLHAAGYSVVLTGGRDDVARAREVDELAAGAVHSVLAGSCDLSDFAALVAGAAVVVSVDTGAAHLASAYGVPSVIIFGPSSSEQWGPPPGPHIVLEHPEERRGEPFADIPDPALLAVTQSEVIAALGTLLGRDLPGGV